METPETTSAPSLDQILGDAMDSYGEEAGPVESPSEEVVEEVVEEEVTETEEEPEEPVATPTYTAPRSLTAEAKEKFSTLPEWAQAEIVKREQDFEKGFAKHTEKARLGEEFEQVAAPYTALIAAEGGSPVAAFKELLQTAAVLRIGTPEQKRELLLQTARDFGVDLHQQEDPGFVDPALASVKRELAELKGILGTQQRETVTSQQQEAFRLIKEFSENPENEFYEDVRAEMQVRLKNGLATSLKDAYDQAIWTVPSVREQLLSRQREQEERKRVDESKKKAQDAKKAAGVKLRSPETAKSSRPKTIEETMSEAYDRLYGT